MCGFAGWVSTIGSDSCDLHILKAMNRTLRHRGPDDEGYFCADNVCLAHRRLSIIDTSTAGRQPLFNENKTVVVVFNGEIYNFLELKERLQRDGHVFRTATDTEVLVHAYEQWGIGFLARLDGMFSLALCDLQQKKLFLAQDPFGKKPLYYGLFGRTFLFASEIKAMVAHPDFAAELDMSAVSKYLACDYVPSPWTIFKKCRKLRAGHVLELDTEDLTCVPESEPHWNLVFEPKVRISQEEAEEEFLRLLARAVDKRLMSDVALGVFLSGGIDSSAIIAVLAQLQKAEGVQTFSISFGEKSFDESAYAREVADKFGTVHHECTLDQEAALGAIPAIVDKLDEPFSDPSLLPTYLLCGFASEHITVALGGDGGDELMAGYDPFVAHKIMRWCGPLPHVFLSALQMCTRLIPASERNMSLDFKLQYFLKGLKPYARKRFEIQNALWLSPFEPEVQTRLFADPDSEKLHWRSVFGETLYHEQRTTAANPLDRLIDSYSKLYLHDDILVKVDRASMMHSLEVRVPFLDKELAAFVARLPESMKLRRGTRKYLLKRAMAGKIPDRIIQRPKKGFGVPIARWFRGELRTLLQDTLASESIKRGGLFQPAFVQSLVDEHLGGRRDHRKQLWALLLFELWRKRMGI